MFFNSRRNFLKASTLATSTLVLSGCNLFGEVTLTQTLSLVQSDLFPYADELGVNTSAYTTLILNHSRVSDEDKAFLKNGVKWLNEEAAEMYKTEYVKLSAQERQNVLKAISKVRWGESWIDTVLTYMMEAMMSDFVYGVNRNEAGQKWVNHIEGYPRPKEPLL